LPQEKLSRDRDARRIGPDGDGVAQGLVHHAERHAIGIQLAEARARAAGDRCPHVRGGQRLQHGGVAGGVAEHADHGLHHREPLHLVVVLAHDPLLAGDLRMAEQR
jgi:hypothetical protein